MQLVRLPHCVKASDSGTFEERLSSALHALPPGTLPLNSCCTRGGMVDDRDIAATVLGVELVADQIRARVGFFFTEVIGGCNCNDDPLEVPAYCVLQVNIDRVNGNAGFTVVAD